MRKALKDYPLVILISLLCVVSSCKKEDDSFHDYAPALAGTWRFVSGSDPEKYLVINKDRTSSVLSSDAQGIRDKNDAILMVTGNQLMIDNSDPNLYPNISIYNYKLKSDSLLLSNPGQAIKLVRLKNSTVATSWVMKVVPVLSFRAPVSEPTDIAFDGSLIWYGNGYGSNYLYNLDPLTGKADSLLVDQYAWSVEADSSDLWVSNDGSENVYKIRGSDGDLITASATMGAWIYGIARDKEFLWCYSNNERTLYKYSIADNLVLSDTRISGNWDGLAMANNFLYDAANGKLHKCTPDPLSGAASYELEGYYIFGVAFDGTSFWVSAFKPPNGYPEIIKLSGVELSALNH
jgi:hypothetical protein